MFGHWDRFQVESYLDHHGEKLARRFDANSYLILNRAMDLHDVARGRGTVARAFAMLEAPVLSISITTDTLYHPRLQVDLADFARHAGVETEYQIIDSPHGHDGFPARVRCWLALRSANSLTAPDPKRPLTPLARA